MRKVKNLEMLGLYNMHKELSTLQLPFKFTIAKNLKTLEDAFNKYKDAQQDLHTTHVLVDGEGNAAIKLSCVELAKGLQHIPYQFFEYKDENAEKEFYEKLNELNNTEVELEIVQESLERKVRFKLIGKDKEEESLTVSLQEYLDEFAENITADKILDLLKHEILV